MSQLQLKRLSIEMENGVTYEADITKVKSVVVRQFVAKATFPLKWDDFTNEITIVFDVPGVEFKRLTKLQLLEDKNAIVVDAEVLDDKP